MSKVTNPITLQLSPQQAESLKTILANQSVEAIQFAIYGLNKRLGNSMPLDKAQDLWMDLYTIFAQLRNAE